MTAPRVVTVTANPALDVSTSVVELRPHDKLRCRPAQREPGGGGINCARVVVELGGDAQAVYAAGGANGDHLARLLITYDIEPTLVPVKGDTRSSFHVHVDNADEQYRFVLPGPELSDDGAERLLAESEAAVGWAGVGTYVIASGSLPPGCANDFYGRLAERVRGCGGRLVLDTSGSCLASASAVGVEVLRNNLREMSELVGRSLDSPADQEAAARSLIDGGAAKVVVMSLGSGGCLAVSADGAWRIAAPPVEVASTVGAGDSLTGALTLALARGETLPVATAYGIGAGSAAVTTARTRLCQAADAERLYRLTLKLNGLSPG